MSPSSVALGPGQTFTETATLTDSDGHAATGSGPAGVQASFAVQPPQDCSPSAGSAIDLSGGKASIRCEVLAQGPIGVTATALFAGQASGLVGTAGAAVALPAVTGVRPAVGPVAGGTRVNVAGTGFVSGRTSVAFGTGAASGVSVTSPTSLTAVAPAATHPGTIDVTVTTPEATSLAGPGDQFTYLSGLVPATATLRVTAAPPAAPAGRSVLIAATLTDAAGQPVSGQTVTFKTSGGSLSAAAAATGAGGRATVLLTDATAETDTVTASTGALAARSTVRVAFTTVPAPPTVAGSVYGADHQQGPIQLGQSVPLVSTSGTNTVTLTPPVNADSLPVQGLSLQLTTPGAGSVAGSVYANVYSTSDALSLLSKTPGIVLSVGAPTRTGQMTCAGPVVNFQTTGAAKQQFGNDQHTTTNADIQVTMPYNDSALLPGESPQVFWLDTAVNPAAWTDAGVSVLSVGTDTITVLLPHLSLYTVVGVTASTATTESVTASPTTGQTATVTAIVLDQNGTPMSGVAVAFSATGSARLSAAEATTNASGQAAASVTNAQAQQVRAAVTGIAAGNTAAVTFVAPSFVGPPTTPSTTTSVQVSAGVGATGGTLASADGSFRLTVPAGVIRGTGSLTVAESSTPPARLPAGTAPASAQFTLSGPALSHPEPATIRYSAAALGGMSPQRLSVYVQEPDGSWRFVPTRVDASTGTVQVYVSGPATLVVLASTRRFRDIPASYWARGDIDALLASGIAGGYPNGTFRPGADLTRAELVKMLALALNLPPASTATAFRDVPSSAWYAPYVAAAVGAGLVDGTSATTFSPNATITRQQMAVLLARALHLSGSATLSFHDASQIAAWAAAGVRAAVAAGYLNGFPDGTFQPLAATTRAQAAKVLAMAIVQMAP